MEHNGEVAAIAHMLVTIHNERYNGNLDANRASTLAIFHETGETLTGDVVTPIKYNNPELNAQFKRLEAIAEKRMCEQIPADLRNTYDPLIMDRHSFPEWPFVKAADKITAYIKCVDEVKSGNSEFLRVKNTTYNAIQALDIAAVNDFMIEFIPSFSLALDELI